MDGRIIVLKERILRNLAFDWTVKEMAKSIDVSESYFQKLFKTENGMTPAKYVCKLRFEKAKELLEDRRFLRIQEICHEIGIHDQTHFTRDFKKLYGKTPSQYRKDYWKEYAPKTTNG